MWLNSESREAIIPTHCFSPNDIEICAAFGIAREFDAHVNFTGTGSLNWSLKNAVLSAFFAGINFNQTSP